MRSLFFMLVAVWLLTSLVEFYKDYLKALSRYDLATNPYAASIKRVHFRTVLVVNTLFDALWAFGYYLLYLVGKWLGFPWWFGVIILLALIGQCIRLLQAIAQTQGYRERQGQGISQEERAQRRAARAQEIAGQISMGRQDVNQPVAPAPPLSATPPSSSAPADGDDWVSFWSWARKSGLHSRLALDKAAGRSTTGMTPREIRQAIEDRERHNL